MATQPRLDRTTLAALRACGTGPAVRLPEASSAGRTPGIVHLGLGAFHRAHQAVFTERAARVTGDDRWAIHGVTQRSPRVRDQLAPQDMLYGVLELSDAGHAVDVMGVHSGVSYPAEDTGRVLDTIAAPTTHVVTLTVTEKGYRRAADGGPDLTDPALVADLAALVADLDSAQGAESDAPCRSAIGMLVRGLARRWRRGAGPLTVVCCDNLLDNGPQVERLVHALVAASAACEAPALLEWLRAEVRFPATMVDRIVPATTDAHRAVAARILGASDAGLVVAEPFMQWVIEDSFAGPRPAWERAGATLTSDVAPFEQTKLRILNGAHSTLAYAGALRGYATIAEAVAAPELRDLAVALVDDDAIPTLGAATEIDLDAYRESVLERFANSAIGHTTVQIAMDGSQKLPIRMLATARARLAAGAVPHAAARAVAEWMLYVRATTAGELSIAGTPVALDDPIAATLAGAAAVPLDSLADRMLGLRDVFGADLAGDDRWRGAVRAAVTEAARDVAATAAVAR